MPETKARRWFKQMTSAVACCHQRGIAIRCAASDVLSAWKLAHTQASASASPSSCRTLHPSTLLIVDHDLVKVADLRCAKTAQDSACRTDPGTGHYTAPEVKKVVSWKDSYDGKRSDMWALGLLLYEMVSREHPFLRAAELHSHPLQVSPPSNVQDLDLI